jgi:hypothetical protein
MNLRYNKSPYDTARTTNQGFVCCHLRIWRNPAYSLGRHDNELTDTTRSPSHYAWCQITLALTHNFATLEKANGKPYCYYPFPLHSSDYKYPLLYPIFTPRYRRHCRNEKCARWNTETVISHHEHWHTSQCMKWEVDPQENLLNKGFYKTKSESLPLGELRRSDDYDWTQTVYGFKLY